MHCHFDNRYEISPILKILEYPEYAERVHGRSSFCFQILGSRLLIEKLYRCDPSLVSRMIICGYTRIIDDLLITRIQGVRGKASQISLIYRTMYGAGPPALLLNAVQGIGEALGIDALACVSGLEQSAHSKDSALFISN